VVSRKESSSITGDDLPKDLDQEIGRNLEGSIDKSESGS
jgi:hypothetical protein